MLCQARAARTANQTINKTQLAANNGRLRFNLRCAGFRRGSWVLGRAGEDCCHPSSEGCRYRGPVLPIGRYAAA